MGIHVRNGRLAAHGTDFAGRVTHTVEQVAKEDHAE